jgi:exonuclease III
MDPAKILIWNVRELNSSSREDVVRTLVEASRANIVCLQETKMADVPRGALLSMLGSDFSSHMALPATGASGGGGSLLLKDRPWKLLANVGLILSVCQFSSAQMRDNLGG